MAPTELASKPKSIDRSARRREKSRDAARCRRQQESDTFDEICNAMPVPSKVLAQMDRSMVMRLMISYMKFRKLMSMDEAINVKDCKANSSAEEAAFDKEYIDALNGFILVLSHDCDILFVSENVKQYIGISSLELMGQNLFGYAHDGDHLEITNCIKESGEDSNVQSFFMRMKSTLTSAGKNINLKSAFYKVLKCDGIVQKSESDDQRYMIAYCEPIPHPTNIEMVLDCNTFLSQHSLNMHFTYCDDDRVQKLLKYRDEDMIGQSYFDFCHTEDIKELEVSYKKLYRLGQITTNRYRMLVKSGGYVWVVSQATVINNPRNQQPSYVVCVHYVISGVTEENCILSLPQMKCAEEIVVMPKLEEVIDSSLEVVDCDDQCFDSTESIFCDSTDSIFVLPRDDSQIIDSTSSIFQPTEEALKNMAKNAPSIGDEIEFKDFNFTDSVLIDEEMCRNAPSIGDPLCDFGFPASPDSCQSYMKKTQFTKPMVGSNPPLGFSDGLTIEDIFSGEDGGLGKLHTKSSGSTERDLNNNSVSPSLGLVRAEDPGGAPSIGMKRKLPKDLQIIAIPKTQYQRHVQPAYACQNKYGTYDGSLSEEETMAGFSNSPVKRQKRQLDTRWGYVEDSWKDGDNADGGKQNFLGLLANDGDAFLSRPRHDDNSWLPILTLHDCEINAPVEEGISALEWMTLSDALASA